MAKKGQAVQLQQELNDDQEWEQYLQKSGLLLIDIYSEWSGPCSAMIATLKKIKLDLGGDNLQLAVAKCDTITDLARFRVTSEPTWMFVVDGHMTNIMFGANAPKLTNIITSELKKYLAYKDGGRLDWKEITDLSEEEYQRYLVKKAIEDEAIRIETEKKERELREWRMHAANHVLETYPVNGVIIVFPLIKDEVKAVLLDLWEPAGLGIAATEKVTFTKEKINELVYFCNYKFNDDDLENLLSEETIVYLIKLTNADALGTNNIEDLVLHFVYGDSKCPPGSRNSPAERLTSHLENRKEEKVEEEEEEGEGDEESYLNVDAEAVPSTVIAVEEAPPEEAPAAEEGAEEGEDEDEEEGSEEGGGSEAASVVELGSKTASESLAPSAESSVQQTPMPSKTVVPPAAVPSLVMEYENTYPVSGLWTPPDRLTTGTAIRLFFPKLYDPIAVPELVATPPHVAVIFEPFKRFQLAALIKEYKPEIMRYGFFTSDDPKKATLIAKNIKEFDKRAAQQQEGEKLVIQISKRKSEAWCVFAQQGPVSMSFNTVEGEKQCKMFFPEGYDEPEEEEEQEVVVVEEKKSKKKGKKVQEEEKAKVEGEEGAPAGGEGAAPAEGEGGAEAGAEQGETAEPATTEDKGTEAEAPPEEAPADAPEEEAPAAEEPPAEAPAEE